MSRLLAMAMIAGLSLCLAGCGDKDTKEGFKKEMDKKLTKLEGEAKDLAKKADEKGGLTGTAAKGKVKLIEASIKTARAAVGKLDALDEAKFKEEKGSIEKMISKIENDLKAAGKDL